MPFALSPIWRGKLSLEMLVSCKQQLTLELQKKFRTDLRTQKMKANSRGVGPRKFMLTPEKNKNRTSKQNKA